MRYVIGVLMGLLVISSANAADFLLKSKKFADKGTIPNLYTCEQGNVSPALSWENPPAKTKSFALLFSSLDTPMGKIYLWVLYNIPATMQGLPEGARNKPDDVLVGKNTLGDAEYRGPCPLDEKEHRFVFTLYALDTVLDLPDAADVDTILHKMNGHILGKAKLRGVFSH